MNSPPPPSLSWLLKLGSSFKAIEYNERWENWRFEFEHLNAIFDPRYSEWELEVVKTKEQWHKPIKLPYKYDKNLSALVVSHYIEDELKGFAESWLLPLQDIKEYWCRDEHKDIAKGSLVVISKVDHWKEESKAKIKAGYFMAESLPYFFVQEGHLIVSTKKALNAYGWANSIDIDEGLEWEY